MKKKRIFYDLTFIKKHKTYKYIFSFFYVLNFALNSKLYLHYLFTNQYIVVKTTYFYNSYLPVQEAF